MPLFIRTGSDIFCFKKFLSAFPATPSGSQTLGLDMADDSTSRWAPSPSLTYEDYSLYSNLSDDELLQLVIERSLSDTQCSAAAQPPHSHDSRQSGAVTNSDRPSYNPPNYSSQDPPAAQTPAHYSSPNPPSEKPPDL